MKREVYACRLFSMKEGMLLMCINLVHVLKDPS